MRLYVARCISELKNTLSQKRPSTSGINEINTNAVKKSCSLAEQGECKPPLTSITKPVLPFLVEDEKEEEIDLDEGYFSIVR